MRLHRFFLKEEIESRSGVIKISDEKIIHQIRNVFRLKSGNKVIVFCGTGIDFECEIFGVDKNDLELKILSEKKISFPKKNVVLFMSIIKKENFELVCEKATELGVSKIVPVSTERTLIKNLNRERIKKILIEASEQSGRGTLPELVQEMKLEEVLNYKNIIVCDMGGKKIQDLKRVDSEVAILVGPEGGWTPDERLMFREKNMQIVSLGESVLRAETAGIVATAFVSI